MNTQLSTKSLSRRITDHSKQIDSAAAAPTKDEIGSEGSWTTDEGSADRQSSCVDDGVRRLEWKDGSFYVGEIDDMGAPNGRGRLVRAVDGAIFEGEWRHGEVMGQGTFQGPGELGTFSGQWRADQLIAGYARVVFEDGAAYEGGWNNQRPEGSGQFINPHGILFRGEWRSGTFQPQLSGYDPRGVVTNNRQYNFTTSVNVDTTESAEVLNRVSTTAADANLSEARLQYNGVPGDQSANIELPAPALALRKGTYDPSSGCFLYDTQEYESPVYPDDPTKSGCRLDAGYMYRTRYNTEVWNDVHETEDVMGGTLEQQQQEQESRKQALKEERPAQRLRKKAGVSNKEGYEDPVDREFTNDEEEFPVEIENDTDQPSKPNTNTCLTCPEPLSAYRVSPAALGSAVVNPAPYRSQNAGPGQYSSGLSGYLPPIQQHATPISYYQPANYLPYNPNILTSSTTGRYEVYPDGMTHASTSSTVAPRRADDNASSSRRDRARATASAALPTSAARKNKREQHHPASPQQPPHDNDRHSKRNP